MLIELVEKLLHQYFLRKIKKGWSVDRFNLFFLVSNAILRCRCLICAFADEGDEDPTRGMGA